MTELFNISPIYLGDGIAVKQIALVTSEELPVYARILTSDNVEERVLRPLATIQRVGRTTAFCTEYRQALDNNDTPTLDSMAPRVAMGFAAFILRKAIWNRRHCRWDGLNDTKALAAEYDAKYKHQEDTLEEHHALEAVLWQQTISLWLTSGLNVFDPDAKPLFEAVKRCTEEYLEQIQLNETPDNAPSSLTPLIKVKEKVEEIVNAFNRCTNAKQLGEIIRNYIKQGAFIKGVNIKSISEAAYSDGLLTARWEIRSIWGNNK